MNTLYWPRNDLRIHDNETLTRFCKESTKGLFVLPSPRDEILSSPQRRKFRSDALSCFLVVIQAKGLRVLRTQLEFTQFLPEFLKINRIHRVYFSEESALHEKREEQILRDLSLQFQFEVCSFETSTLFRRNELPFELDTMPFQFTPWMKALGPSPQIPKCFPVPDQWPDSLLDLPLERTLGQGGESAGLARLNHYFRISRKVMTYKETRNGLLEEDDSTKFSPYLAQGCLSARYVAWEIKDIEEKGEMNSSTQALFYELLWSDYFKFFSQKYGAKIFQIKGIKGVEKSYDLDQTSFELWCQGETEDDFVNANMRELNSTGWMSNRGRQNVASYLIHNLHLPWIWGAQYFEKKLMDYDPDLNWGNWLYHSGQGSDPRSRKFNLELQAQTYDPEGTYRKRWGKGMN